MLTSSELDTFMTFIEDDTKDTALPFYYPDYIRNTERLVRITSYSVSQESASLFSVEIEMEALP